VPYLVLIETSKKQGFIFSTNKLKEQMGASQLIYKAGVDWVLEACKEACGTTAIDASNNIGVIRDSLLDKECNPTLGDSSTNTVEYLVLSSGKALLLASNKTVAQKIIRRTTLSAVKNAPGLGVNGFYEAFDWDENDISDVSRRLHRRFEGERFKLPGQEGRFGRLPIVADCETSGLGASEIVKTPEGKDEPVSSESFIKRNEQPEAKKRFDDILKRHDDSSSLEFTDRLDELEMETGWIAVIHADGNDIGKLFMNFGDFSVEAAAGNGPVNGETSVGSTGESGTSLASKNRRYIEELRRFSIALDECTEKAFVKAIVDVSGDCSEKEAHASDGGVSDTKVPIVPIVVGGDDLTVVCTSDIALDFTKRFLEFFEEETGKTGENRNGVVPAITGTLYTGAGGSAESGHLAACAGVTFVKPHFPFSSAYSLTESLVRSAKAVKAWDGDNPISALDFHFLFDSSFTGLEDIRELMKVKDDDEADGEKSRLYGGPYVISEPDEISEKESGETSAADWQAEHHWNRLKERVAALEKSEDNDGELPASQIHWLIDGMFMGKTEADSRYGLIKGRYEAPQINALTAKKAESLYWEEKANGRKEWVTGLLDAKFAKSFINKRF